MPGDESVPTSKALTPGALLGLQAAGILVAALVLGVTYNSASPLGVRATRPGDTAPTPSASASPPATATLPAPVVRTGYVNQTVAMTLELAAPNLSAATAPAPSPSPSHTHTLTFPRLAWVQVKPLLAANKIILVDARLRENYDVSHIPGAISFPASSSAAELQAFATRFGKDTAFVIYCGSEQCHMSHALAESFVKICGYTNVSEMPGGMAEYLAAQSAPAPAAR